MLTSENDAVVKVLFVDDEISILKSLQRSFLLADFEIITANNAREGLKILEQESIDIVITDYRMPEIDGLQFLKIVKEKYPGVSRVILSGFVEHSAVLKALTSGLATTYFAKPWKDSVLSTRIQHILETRKILHSKKLLDLVNSIEKLPTLPSLYQQFIEAIEQEKPIKEIAEIIKKDASIATKILQVANSAFYSLKGPISIEHAIAYIGLNSVKDIILTISLTSSMRWNKTQIRQLQEIFVHSSLVNRYIPKFYKLRKNKKKIIQFPAIGLTHDIGKIILLQYFPERYNAIYDEQQRHPEKDFYKCELELGFHKNTHAEIGAYFLDWWNLPEIIVEAALFHHTPEESTAQYKEILETTHFTDILVNHLCSLPPGAEPELSKFQKDNLTIEQMATLVQSIKEEIDDQYKI